MISSCETAKEREGKRKIKEKTNKKNFFITHLLLKFGNSLALQNFCKFNIPS